MRKILFILLCFVGFLYSDPLIDEGFESNNEIPSGWTVINEDNDGNAWTVRDNGGNHGDNYMMVQYNSSGNNDWLITPKLGIRDGEILQFWGKSSFSFLEDFNVKISKTGNQIEDFDVIIAEERSIPNEYTEFTYTITDNENVNAGDSVYIAIQCVSVDKFRLSVDDFKVYTMDTEPVDAPDQVIAERIGQDVNIRWTMPNEDFPEEPTEGFEGTFPPFGWMLSGDSAYGWHKEVSVVAHNVEVDPHEGNYQIGVGITVASFPTDEWLITPEFEVVDSMNLRFWTSLRASSSDMNCVKISTDNGNNWEVIWDNSDNPGQYGNYVAPVEVELSDYVGESVKLAWHAYVTQSTALSWWLIDDIRIGTDTELFRFPTTSSNRALQSFKIFKDDGLLIQIYNTDSRRFREMDVSNETHTYYVVAVYDYSESEPSPEAVVTSVDNEDIHISSTKLLGNYPNPFNPETSIHFNLEKRSHVSLKVFNVKGQEVKTLVYDEIQAGQHKITWNGNNKSGNKVASGIYYIKMVADNYQHIKKTLLLK